MDLQENISLAPYTSLKIGGPARYFCIARSKDDFVEALKFAQDKSIKFFILGSGSNLLITEAGFDGLVIRNQSKSIRLEDGLIVAGTGITLPEIHVFANQNGLVGFERLATVPGTLGGALYNNAHYLDDLISNFIKSVTVIDPMTGETQVLNSDQLAWGYDTSKIKTDKLVAVEVALLLNTGDVTASRKYFLELLKGRGEKQPYGTANAGCMFQNVPREANPDLKDAPGFKGVSAGWLVHQAGLAGTKHGNMEISSVHGNFFVNKGGGKSQDVLDLIELCKEEVYNKFKVKLELEIKILK